MRTRYFGKKVVRNEFGEIVRVESPTVLIVFKEGEAELVEKLLCMTAYNYDVFGCEGEMSAYVPVLNKEDADSFMEEWKSAKMTAKKG